MKYRSTLLAEVRGSMAGVTASRNKGGLYLRARATPTNPSSTAQQAVRTAFAAAVIAWNSLTANQRNAWNAYADQTPMTDSIGQTIHNSGRSFYIGQFAFQIRIGEAGVSAAPGTPGLGSLGTPGAITVSAATGLTVTFTGLSPLDPNILAAMGPPVSAGVIDYHGPYTLAAFTVEDAAFSSAAIAAGRWGVPVAGQRRPFRFTACDPGSGKLFNEFTTIVTVGA